MQVPLLATSLVIGLCQLLAPAISFTIDMRPHCLGLRHNVPVLAVVFVPLTLGIVWVLAPGAFDLLLRQDQVPLNFRAGLLVYVAGWVVVLTILVKLLRWCIETLHARRLQKISTAFYVPASTDSFGGIRPAGRKSSDGRGASRRSTGTSDIGDWLRRTATAVVDLSTFLPTGRSNKVAQDQLPA